MANVEIEIYDKNEVFLGTGPIIDVISLSFVYILSEAGEFSFSIPVGDTHKNYCAFPNTVKIYLVENDGYRRYVFQGKIKTAVTELSERALPVLTVSGLNVGTELGERLAHMNFADSYYHGTNCLTSPSDICDDYNAYTGKNWTLDSTGAQKTGSGTWMDASGKISHLTLLSDIAKDLMEYYIFKPGRKLKWILGNNFISSGLHAVILENYDKNDLPSDTLPILSAEIEATSDEIVTDIYAVDKNDKKLPETYDVPSGFEFYYIRWWNGTEWQIVNVALRNSALAAQIGVIDVLKKYDSVDTTDGLVRAAVNYLKNHGSVTTEYSIKVTNLAPLALEPGQSLRVDCDLYSDTGKLISIHESLVCISIETSVDASGKIDTELELSNTGLRVLSDDDLITVLTKKFIASTTKYC